LSKEQVKKYKIAGQEYVQEELSFRQLKDVSNLIAECIDSFDVKALDDINAAKVAKVLVEKSIVENVLNILLKPADNTFEKPADFTERLNDLKMSVIAEIISDFFVLNEKWTRTFLSSLLDQLSDAKDTNT